jgi:hypothetical protein
MLTLDSLALAAAPSLERFNCRLVSGAGMELRNAALLARAMIRFARPALAPAVVCFGANPRHQGGARNAADPRHCVDA